MTAPTVAARVDLSDLGGLFDEYARILLRYTAQRVGRTSPKTSSPRRS